LNNTTKYDLTILYVEDDRISREVTLDVTEGLFKNIIVAKNGEDGFLKFQKDFNTNKEISLIITDIEMPKLNGFEMLSKIRELDKDIFSIIISGHSFNHYMKDISKADILNNYLPKPLIIKDLITLIDDIIIKIDEKLQFKKKRSLYVQYQNAFDYSAIVLKTDIDGIIIYANDAFCDISGYKRDELIGESHNIVRHPDMPQSDIDTMWETIKAKMVFRYQNMKNKAKDGSTYYVDVVILPILDENREIYEYIAICHDTTALHNSLLEERKAKKTQQIFLANMSHEIRTPLNGVIGFTKLLKQSDLKDKQKEYVDVIDSSANSLLHTINEILDISKLQDGNMDIELIDFDPYLEFISIKKLLEVKADEKNINLVCQVCEENKLDKNKEITLIGDILKLKQVLLNLLSNAIKFTPEDGKVVLDISMRECNESLAKFIFSVQDTGIGVPKEKQKAIFEPFKQANESTTREFGGTGLGLSISKQIVELLGGELKLDSTEGKGSKFYFELNLKYKKQSLEKNENKQRDENFKGKILVADDVDINQQLIEILLSQMGLESVLVPNGLEAVKVFEKQYDQFDLVFLDINMPVMDGMESCTKINMIKKYKMISNIPIIALTANSIKGDKERYLENGFDGYLSKPIDQNKLYDILDQFLLPHKDIKKTTNIPFDIEAKSKKTSIPVKFYQKLLDNYLNMIDDEIVILEQFIQNDEVPNIKIQAHKLKGVSINLALDKIFELFSSIEIKADIQNKKELESMIRTIKEDIKQIKAT